MRDSEYYAGGYSSSHATEGYGERYGRTFSAGYYAIEWNLIERDLLIRCLRSLDGEKKRCLDFACGTGRISSAVAEVCPEVVGVDVSSAMLEAARPPANAKLQLRDIIADPLPEQFPLATSFRFFLNAEPGLREAAMGAIARQLEEGGHLIANIHVNANSPVGIIYRIRNRLTRRLQNRTLLLSDFEALGRRHGLNLSAVHWYGFAPRFGNFVYPGMHQVMLAMDWIGHRLWFGKSLLAQSFICVFEKPRSA